MRIKSFSYKDKVTGWNIKNLDFGRMTLLVGASGVGKSMILKALLNLVRIARGVSFNGIQWNIEFEDKGVNYIWKGSFEVKNENYDILVKKNDCKLIDEQIIVDKEIIVDRKDGEIIFNKQKTVKLDVCKSAIELLKEENVVDGIYNAFNRIKKIDDESVSSIRVPRRLLFDDDWLANISKVRDADFLNVYLKLFFIGQNDKQLFSSIKEQFIDIFPLVEDFDFKHEHLFEDKTYPIFRIKERGVDTWIRQDEMSSGMFKVLSYIVELHVADNGDVILIDEFENGLGVNCIDQLADLVVNPENDVQIIMTSHHPYIINSIPFMNWRIVTRKNSDVMINTAEELNIGTHSRHDAFMQLIQNPAYKTGQR